MRAIGAFLLLFIWQACVSQDRPNILLLVAEDLSPRIGAFGDTIAVTPNLDELADNGVRYTRAFTTAGVCSPSRAALITGMHQVSIGAQHMRAIDQGYLSVPPADVKAFPELMRAAGYYTFTNQKLDYQFSELFSGTGPFTIWDVEGQGVDWQGRAPGQPFFGLINFLETHESRLRQEWRDAGSYLPERVTDPDDVILPPYFSDTPEVRADIAQHYDNIHYMDQLVGEWLARLEAEGLSDNTIVIWTTDHGDALPRAKRDLYDSGIHVPMVVSLPDSYIPEGWSAGSIDERLVSFVDFAPTILEWAGIELPGYLQGQSFLGEVRSYIYASRDRIDSVNDRERAIRDSRYKYIRSWFPELPNGHVLEYRDNIAMVNRMRLQYENGELDAVQSLWFEPTGQERLYDTLADPYEITNLAEDIEYAEVKRRLREELTRRFSEIGDWSEESEEVMRSRFLDENGVIRQTPQPLIEVRNGLLHITVADGSSVAYRVAGGPWILYHDPIPTPSGGIEAKAVRYGWRESEVTRH